MSDPVTTYEHFKMEVEIHEIENNKWHTTFCWIDVKNGVTFLHWPKKRPMRYEVALAKSDVQRALVFANAVTLAARQAGKIKHTSFIDMCDMIWSMVKQ